MSIFAFELAGRVVYFESREMMRTHVPNGRARSGTLLDCCKPSV